MFKFIFAFLVLGIHAHAASSMDSFSLNCLEMLVDDMRTEPTEQTQWWVLTGTSCAGKSTAVEALALQGFAIRTEASRNLIDEELCHGKTKEQILGNQDLFSNVLLERKIRAEASSPVNETIFWDRGIPDHIGILRQYGIDTTLSEAASQRRRYRGVFILDPLPFEADYARVETGAPEARVRDQQALLEAYQELGYHVIRVPVAPVPERVRFILEHAGLR